MDEQNQTETQQEPITCPANCKKPKALYVVLFIVYLGLFAIIAFGYIQYEKVSEELESAQIELDELALAPALVAEVEDDESMIGDGAAPSYEGMSDWIYFRDYAYRIPEDWTYKTMMAGSGDTISDYLSIHYYDADGIESLYLSCPAPETGYEAWTEVTTDTRKIVSTTNARFIMGEPVEGSGLDYLYRIIIQTTYDNEDGATTVTECEFSTMDSAMGDEETYYDIYKSILLHL